MDQIKAVVFDIGKVLIEWHPEQYYDGEIGVDRRRDLFSAVDLYAMNEQIDLGAPFRETVYALADQRPEYAAEIRMWHDRWLDIASPEIPWSVHLMRAVRSKNVPVFALSNFGIGTFDLAATRYAFFNEFDQQYVSGYLQMQKPDHDIYAALEAGSGLSGAALLFTDDRPENIETATARGWAAHLFEGPEGWAKTLVRNNILTTAEAGL